MSTRVNNRILERFVQADIAEYAALRQEYKQGGYSMFSELLEGLRQLLLSSEEGTMAQVQDAVAKGRAIIPDPGSISPSWERVWDDYERCIEYKREALAAIAPEDREGEWQIVMDNPFTNDGIACYPALSFAEAAYLYAYFRKDLKKNEYLRLQKIINLLTTEGR
ncbi:MAG: hypothetical protein K0R57_5783 [Paenibacillaceae bacterium]|jgi:hypothetical protein|nr:hypothetical protein [Paenibacillaceae bacterium]